ncbi:MAG: hypothetical protein VX589_16530 [Myxococcota bacterium]|nr:hypothetical protein [Myxococcota bacterium]
MSENSTGLTRLKSRAFLVATSLIMSLVLGQASATEVGGEGFLVQDKVILGVDGGGFFGRTFGLHLDAALVFSGDDAPATGVKSQFIGALLGLHLVGRITVLPMLEARGGIGVDIWPLWGIDAEETLVGLPVFAEARIFASIKWSVFGRLRYYLVHSDRMQPGEDFEGKTHTPVVLSVGFGRHF